MKWKPAVLAFAVVAVVSVLVVVFALVRPGTEDATLAGTSAGTPEGAPEETQQEKPSKPRRTKVSAGEDIVPFPEPTDLPPPRVQDNQPEPQGPAPSFDPDRVADLKEALRESLREQEHKQEGESSPGDKDLELLPTATLDFTLSSFNVLGSSHTARGGNRPGLPAGTTRIRWVAGMLAQQSVDVVGFQEFQLDQQRTFLRHTRGKYDIYPGFSKGGKGTNNSIAWRRDSWEVVSAGTVPIPYFNGNRWPMPVVLLRHKASGLSAYFTNFHNPASTQRHPGNQRWKRLAATIEAALVRRIQERSDFPVFLTGDLNERLSVFCLMTGRGGLVAANGGSNNGRCVPPRDLRIDWIFGSRDVQFYGYRSLTNRASDHPMVVSNARIQGGG